MAFFSWSLTAANNATADGTINWAEGQAPSSVNDSSRAMMARLKEWGNDTDGHLISAGGTTAYTLTTNQAFTSLAAMDRSTVTWLQNTTNTGPTTLNVDGLGAKPLRSAQGTDIGAGVLVSATVYRATYYNSTQEWVLHSFFGNPFTVPVGGCIDFFGSTVPNSNFVFPTGQAISRTTYSVLFGIIGTTYGAGDGSTTFTLPDLRGKVTAALDNMGGSAVGVTGGTIGTVVTDNLTIVGTTLGSKGGSSTHALTVSEMPAHAHPGSTVAITDTHSHQYQRYDTSVGSAPYSGPASTSGQGVSTQTSGTNSGSITASPSIASQGSSTAHALLQPTMIVNKIMRII